MTPVNKSDTTNVLNVRVNAIDMAGAIRHVQELLLQDRKGYICVAGVHGIMEARRSPVLANAYANADLTIPDGMPLVWVGHAQGYKTMQRVTGPEFMLELFRRREFANLTHYFYGGEGGVAEQLRSVLHRRFPHARIVGVRTPPFQELTEYEGQEFVTEIRSLRPDIIWVGISCPKQELFMQRYLALLETRIMVGVGAAFDYHTGRIRDSAEWVKRAGLQWLHRLIQDPKRLWKRYLRTNPPFVLLIIRQLLLERLHPAPPLPVACPRLATPEQFLGPSSEIQEERVGQSAVA
jgi:N-acetylglucosaminyldiphosphoundecaprenol N-acetyl-beta-D-mannosaminyltransferase